MRTTLSPFGDMWIM